MTDSHNHYLGGHKIMFMKGTFNHSQICCIISGNNKAFLYAMIEVIDAWIDNMA